MDIRRLHPKASGAMGDGVARRMTTRVCLAASMAAFMTAGLAVATPSHAQDAAPESEPNTEAATQTETPANPPAVEDDLDALLGLPSTPGSPGGVAPKPAGDANNPTVPSSGGSGGGLAERLGLADQPGLPGVLAQMDLVTNTLTQDGPGLTTQRQQQSVLAKLDALIEEAKKQQQQQQSQSQSQSPSPSQSQQKKPDASANQPGQQQQKPGQPKPGQPATGDQAQADRGQVRDVDPSSAQSSLEELRTNWGQLPPRVREALLQGQSQQMSAVYRQLTQAYFERLAELNTPAPAPGSIAPGTSGTP